MSKKYKTDKRLSQGKIIGKRLKEIILRAINPPFSLSLMDNRTFLSNILPMGLHETDTSPNLFNALLTLKP